MKCRCGYEGKGNSGIERLSDLVAHMAAEGYVNPFGELREQVEREAERERLERLERPY